MQEALSGTTHEEIDRLTRSLDEFLDEVDNGFKD